MFLVYFGLDLLVVFVNEVPEELDVLEVLDDSMVELTTLARGHVVEGFCHLVVLIVDAMAVMLVEV